MFSTKYFPSRLVFDARSSKGSYAWQSILKARCVIENGMLWRIGAGTQIRVFHDKWILGLFPTKAVPQALSHMDDSTVSSLIDQVTKEWSGQLIDHSIAPFIAQNIKAIPLWRTMQEDCLVWPQNRDGNYSVKAGYQLLGDLETREATSGSSRADQRSFWNGIWKLHIPYKIKNFCWQACIDSFPTLANLHPQKILMSPLCSNCGKVDETTLHAL